MLSVPRYPTSMLPRTRAQRIAALQRATRRFGAGLLPGFYEDWVMDEQNRIQTLYEHATTVLEELGTQTRDTVTGYQDPTHPPVDEPGGHLPMQFTHFF